MDARAALSGALVGEKAAHTSDLRERAGALWHNNDGPGAEERSCSTKGCLAEIAGNSGAGVEPGTEITADEHGAGRLRHSPRLRYEVAERRAERDFVDAG